MSRPVHAPIAPPRPRPTGSFTEPRCGAPFGPAACELGGKSIARTASRRRGPRLLAGLLGIAVLAFASAFDCPAESRIGRLFSTVEQRIELDRLRDRPAAEPVTEPAASEVEPEAAPGLALDPEPAPEPDATSLMVTVNGLVIRSDGHRLAWVDGVEAGVEAMTHGGIGIEVDRTSAGRVRIRLPERGVHAELKPGQTIDVVRGGVFEAYEPLPVHGAADVSGGRTPEPDIADPSGVRCPDSSPIHGCGRGPVKQ